MPTRTLSEDESKRFLAGHGLSMPPDQVVPDARSAGRAADEIGYPVVVKLCGDGIAHKTERGLVRLGLGDRAAVEAAAAELLGLATADDGDVAVLVAPMVTGTRELIAGLVRDPHFGMTVMLGVGGILAEALGDVVFRLTPIDEVDARDMIDELRTQALLGGFRGEPEVDRDALVSVLTGLSSVGSDPDVESVDINPLIVSDGIPVPVDALVELRSGPDGAA